MSAEGLDEIDLGILHLLQEDARNYTPVDMAKQLPVSDQTVRNRIEKMERMGVLEGYVPVIDYQNAGFPIRLEFCCTAPVQRREELAQAALEIDHVVRVEEMLSAQENVRVLAVSNDSEEINDIATQIDNLGLTIVSERLRRRTYIQPFNHFGAGIVSDP
ncbi:Lrp/AsnC family transcriptional regulator [Halopelagius longus]|uniref:AsnC family transcriptional regulator n=1 Tax=Halopelagius longus TaxID=1236180 RepID=A0A1H1EA57_9EURY|nr:AsnC family transcriptional regulator [Halopelagius longus]RDI71674.1 AsnC family transcriptional regulator [Halopelagius longus]SDQ85691.1 DNA-binding transcriptional regulator, Lrp family [Halopelagius longus]